MPCSLTSKVILFADDTTVVGRNEGSTLLNKSVSENYILMEEWFLANKLSINADKTQILKLSLKHTSGMDNVKSIKLLGVHLDCKMTWEDHTLNLEKKISRNIFLIRQLRDRVSEMCILSSYYGFIHCNLSYAILVWGHSAHTSRLFALQRR